MYNTILVGDCLEVLSQYPDASMNLIMTSPPYAEKRGAFSADTYVEWFLPRAEELRRVLHPDRFIYSEYQRRGADGERQLYVMDLVKALKGTRMALD